MGLRKAGSLGRITFAVNAAGDQVVRQFESIVFLPSAAEDGSGSVLNQIGSGDLLGSIGMA